MTNKEEALRKIYKLVHKHMWNEDIVIGVLNELLELYYLKHNGNRKKLFIIEKIDSDYNNSGIDTIFGYDKLSAKKEYIIKNNYDDIKSIYSIDELINKDNSKQSINHLFYISKT